MRALRIKPVTYASQGTQSDFLMPFYVHLASLLMVRRPFFSTKYLEVEIYEVDCGCDTIKSDFTAIYGGALL